VHSASFTQLLSTPSSPSALLSPLSLRIYCPTYLNSQPVNSPSIPIHPRPPHPPVVAAQCPSPSIFALAISSQSPPNLLLTGLTAYLPASPRMLAWPWPSFEGLLPTLGWQCLLPLLSLISCHPQQMNVDEKIPFRFIGVRMFFRK
jgi:hypothetical protein